MKVNWYPTISVPGTFMYVIQFIVKAQFWGGMSPFRDEEAEVQRV